MKQLILAAVGTVMLSCQHPTTVLSISEASASSAEELTAITFPEGSWQHFLQHLPLSEGSVVDYRGVPVSNQIKAVAIVNYDVGTKDLQQCADALMRLRAEYLFSKGRYDDIRFRFTSGDLYTFQEYCQGIRPVAAGTGVTFSILTASADPTHDALRRYLDIVYTYAGTISLAKELRPASTIEVGTVIIKPGSPGHCSIIVDEATTPAGDKVYKLAEGYTPAQSIYILKNPEDGSPWYKLTKDVSLKTSSYFFESYQLKRFE